MISDDEQTLNDALARSLEIHNQNPKMYYLETGDNEEDREKIKICKEVFKALKVFAHRLTPDWFKSDEAVPNHPKFAQIKRHIDQIRFFYSTQESQLIRLFMRKLLPSNPLPLRFAILSSVSLFSTRVYIHSSKLRPQPLQAYIDGYFNFVVNMGENVIRYPLLPDKNAGEMEGPELPPSIRFIGAKSAQNADIEGSQSQIQQYVLQTAPKNGRRQQFHSFVSILNSGKPVSDFLESFSNALTSFDLSFATAICALASDPDSINSIISLINILAVNQMFDHFLRCLATSVKQAITGYLIEDVPELIALDNLFISSSLTWARTLATDFHGQDLPEIYELVERICNDIMNKRINSNYGLYILKAILVISAYDDQSGDAAIAMFMEVVVRPFAIGLQIGNNFVVLKESLARSDENVADIQRLIEKTIVKILGMKISVTYNESKVTDQLFEIHNFVTQKIDPFVRMIVALNARKERDHPVIQTITFAFTKCGDLAMY